MSVQVITDDIPMARLGIGRDDGLQMGQEIGFRARRSARGSQDLSGDDIAAHEQ